LQKQLAARPKRLVAADFCGFRIAADAGAEPERLASPQTMKLFRVIAR
jgi:hypothetical protein